jgi:hypothetical protein
MHTTRFSETELIHAVKQVEMHVSATQNVVQEGSQVWHASDDTRGIELETTVPNCDSMDQSICHL